MILDLFRKGQQELQRKHSEAESKKSGVLRGGSVGLAMEPNKKGDTDIAGGCAGLAYLRFKGIDTSSMEQGTSTRELMFEAGRTNEDSWYAVLAASGYTGKILREEEVPVDYTLDNGTRITGRPDMVLMGDDNKPVRGIELKLVSSIWTARTVLLTKTPKLSHVTQSAHYAIQLAKQYGLEKPLPFELWYTNRADFETKADFSLNAYPAYGEPGSSHFAYRFYQVVADPSTGSFTKRVVTEKQYNMLVELGEEVEAVPAKYLPFIQGFHIVVKDDGSVWYRDALDATAALKPTVVTAERIKRYYTLVSELKKVPNEPITIKVDGKKENFKLSAYCSLGRLCCKNQAGREISSWATEVADLVATEMAMRELSKMKREKK